MTTYFAACDSLAIYAVSADRDTVRDEAAREAGYTDYETMQECLREDHDGREPEGLRVYEIAEDAYRSIMEDGWYGQAELRDGVFELTAED